jgi:DNA-binding MarR family transcriptional regulator
MTEEFGISHRQLQILRILWDAGKPIPRLEVLRKLNDDYGEPIEDASLRSHLRRMDEKDMLVRELAEREPGTLGRTPTLYSASPTAQEILTKIIDTLFGDILRDDPTYLAIARRRLEKRLAETEKGSSSKD